MKMCFNWKVLAGLATVGVTLFVFASPSLALAALPFLLLAACPLSMIFMMWGMRNMNGSQEGTACSMMGQPGNKQNLSREQRLAELQAQYQRLHAEQAELAEQIAAAQAAKVSEPAATEVRLATDTQRG